MGSRDLTNDYVRESLTDRAIFKMGREVILVADYSKTNHVFTAQLAPLTEENTRHRCTYE